jgi:hypothetical protein
MTPIAVFTIASYLPDAVTPHFETFKDTLVWFLQKLGIVPERDISPGDLSHLMSSWYKAHMI